MKPIVIGIVAGLALGYLVGYNNLYARQQSRVRLIQQQLAQEKTDQQARQETADLISQVERYQAKLPSEPDPSWLVREARAVGQKVGITITSISQQNPEPGKQATVLSITLRINANYHQLGRFLDELEHGKHFIRVDQLSVASGRNDSEKPAIQVTLSTLYVPPLLAKAAAPVAPVGAAPAIAKPAAAF